MKVVHVRLDDAIVEEIDKLIEKKIFPSRAECIRSNLRRDLLRY